MAGNGNNWRHLGRWLPQVARATGAANQGTNSVNPQTRLGAAFQNAQHSNQNPQTQANSQPTPVQLAHQQYDNPSQVNPAVSPLVRAIQQQGIQATTDITSQSHLNQLQQMTTQSLYDQQSSIVSAAVTLVQHAETEVELEQNITELRLNISQLENQIRVTHSKTEMLQCLSELHTLQQIKEQLELAKIEAKIDREKAKIAYDELIANHSHSQTHTANSIQTQIDALEAKDWDTSLMTPEQILAVLDMEAELQAQAEAQLRACDLNPENLGLENAIEIAAELISAEQQEISDLDSQQLNLEREKAKNKQLNAQYQQNLALYQSQRQTVEEKLKTLQNAYNRENDEAKATEIAVEMVELSLQKELLDEDEMLLNNEKNTLDRQNQLCQDLEARMPIAQQDWDQDSWEARHGFTASFTPDDRNRQRLEGMNQWLDPAEENQDLTSLSLPFHSADEAKAAVSTDEEVEFFFTHNRWPTLAENRFHSRHGRWPNDDESSSLIRFEAPNEQNSSSEEGDGMNDYDPYLNPTGRRRN